MDKKCFKIAVPIFEWRVAPRLDMAEKMLFATVEGGKIVNEEEIRLVGVHPLNIAHWFKDEGISVVICCGIDATCSSLLMESGIVLVSWIAGNARKAIRAYLNGTLDRMAISTDTLGEGPFRRRFRGGRWGNE